MKRLALFVILLTCVASVVIHQLTHAEQLTVTATVPAQVTDYSAEMSSNITVTTLGQNQIITYTLTYGSTLSYPSTISLKANWSRGTIEGNNDPSVDVLSYVSGSAEEGYGNAVPIIDTVNRTITWNISSLPGNTTSQTVSFQLRTSSSLTSIPKIAFSVSGDLVGPGIQTPLDTLTNQFQSIPVITPTNTPTPEPTSQPTPTTTVVETTGTPVPTSTATPVPTITPSPSSLDKIIGVDVRTILPNQVTLTTNLSSPGEVLLQYGTNLANLETQITFPSAKNHLLTLDGLSESTQYFYQIRAIIHGKTITSDIYSVITGQVGDIPQPVISTLVVASGNTILSSPQLTSLASPGATPTLLLPVGSLYEFRITIPNAKNLKLAQAIVRNHNVLGFGSFISQADASTQGVDLVEISPNVFAGKLKTPATKGVYDIIVRIEDTNGNITEKKISQLSVLSRFMVRNKRTNEPVEATQVLLSLWNKTKNRYERLRSESTSIQNPQFTNAEGSIDTILPRGKYKATVSNLSFTPQDVVFTIGDGPGDGYPEVLLVEAPFSIVNTFLYFKSSLFDVYISETITYFAILGGSRRMLHLAAITILTSSAILVVLSLSHRTQVPLINLFSYLNFHRKNLGKKRSVDHLQGTITDAESGLRLSGVSLYISEAGTKKLIAQTISQKGTYTFNVVPNGHYTLEIMKPGYLVFSLPISINQTAPVMQNIALSQTSIPVTLQDKLIKVGENILEISFEAVLVILLITSLCIGFISGWTLVLPYLTIGLLNLFIWIRHKTSH